MTLLYQSFLKLHTKRLHLRGTAVAGPANLEFPGNLPPTIEGRPLKPAPLPVVFPSIAIRAGPRDWRAFSMAGLSPPSVCRLLLLLLILLYRPQIRG